jgi:hypothetical protein
MGLAVTDPLGITAQGLETLERRNKHSDFARLEKTIRQYQVREIVLGYPLRMSGEAGTQSQMPPQGILTVKIAGIARNRRHRRNLVHPITAIPYRGTFSIQVPQSAACVRGRWGMYSPATHTSSPSGSTAANP